MNNVYMVYRKEDKGEVATYGSLEVASAMRATLGKSRYYVKKIKTN